MLWTKNNGLISLSFIEAGGTQEDFVASIRQGLEINRAFVQQTTGRKDRTVASIFGESSLSPEMGKWLEAINLNTANSRQLFFQ